MEPGQVKRLPPCLHAALLADLRFRGRRRLAGSRAWLKLGWRRGGGGYDDVADAVMAGAAARAGRGEPPYVTRGPGVSV